MTTILYPEDNYPDDSVEREVFGPSPTILVRNVEKLSELSDEDCAATERLMLFRHWASAADLARFPNLRTIVRMGVGYDRIDRVAAAKQGIMVCNVPDYGTMEVADHAIALAIGCVAGCSCITTRSGGRSRRNGRCCGRRCCAGSGRSVSASSARAASAPRRPCARRRWGSTW